MPYSKYIKTDKGMRVEDVTPTICIFIVEIIILALFDSRSFVYKLKVRSVIC